MEHRIARVAFNRKDGLKGSMQTRVIPALNGHEFLQKVTVALDLGLQQVRHVENGAALAKILP